MTIKNCTIEVELDDSTLYKLLDDVAEYVNGFPNEKLSNFIKNAFYITNRPEKGASSLLKFIFKDESRYLEFLPELKAGSITFEKLCDILADVGFIPIQQPPPISIRPILVRLFDKWRGKGREIEIVTVRYDGVTYTTIKGKQIPKRFITGWKTIYDW